MEMIVWFLDFSHYITFVYGPSDSVCCMYVELPIIAVTAAGVLGRTV